MSATASIAMKVDGATTSPTVLSASEAATRGFLVVPGEGMVLSAEYSRLGDDLVLRGPDGRVLIIDGYFALETLPDLIGEDQARIPGDLARQLAGSMAAARYVQASLAPGALPIGKVETLSGTVDATRADGSKVTLAKGDPVFEGDILETGKKGAIGIVFADDSTFSLGDGGRMVLDELVYDPGARSGKATFSVMQGVFTFVSGQIAKTELEAMSIRTPTATIGVRGTAGNGKIDSQGQGTFALMEEIDPKTGQPMAGEMVIRNGGGVQTLNQPFQATNVASFDAAPSRTFIMSAQDFGRNFGSSLISLPRAERSLSSEFRQNVEAGHQETIAREQGQAAGEKNGAEGDKPGDDTGAKEGPGLQPQGDGKPGPGPGPEPGPFDQPPPFAPPPIVGPLGNWGPVLGGDPFGALGPQDPFAGLGIPPGLGLGLLGQGFDPFGGPGVGAPGPDTETRIDTPMGPVVTTFLAAFTGTPGQDVLVGTGVNTNFYFPAVAFPNTNLAQADSVSNPGGFAQLSFDGLNDANLTIEMTGGNAGQVDYFTNMAGTVGPTMVTFSEIGQLLLADATIPALGGGYLGTTQYATGDQSQAPSKGGDVIVFPSMENGEKGTAMAGTAGVDTVLLDDALWHRHALAFGKDGGDVFDIRVGGEHLLIGGATATDNTTGLSDRVPINHINSFTYANLTVGTAGDWAGSGLLVALFGDGSMFSSRGGGSAFVGDGSQTVTFLSQPMEGGTFTLYQVGGSSTVFEFDTDNSVTGGTTKVTIGANVAATASNLRDAMENVLDAGSAGNYTLLQNNAVTLYKSAFEYALSHSTGTSLFITAHSALLNDLLWDVGSFSASPFADAITIRKFGMVAPGFAVVDAGGGNDFVSFHSSANDMRIANLNGGNGTDTLDLANLTSGVTIDTSQATDVSGGMSGINITQFSNFETIVGTSGADILVGTASVENFTGNAGNDTMTGGGGADILSGADGDDIFFAKNDDLVTGESLSGGNGTDYLKLIAGQSLLDLGNVTPAAIEVFDLSSGDSAGSTVRLNAGDLSALAEIIGTAGGSDKIELLDSADFTAIAFNGIEGLDLVSNAHYAVTVGNANVGAGGALIITASGVAGANTVTVDGSAEIDGALSITGGPGNDNLGGGSGSDLLVGGSGNDNLGGNAGADTLIGGTGADQFDLGAGDAVADVIKYFNTGDLGDTSVSGFLSGSDKFQFVATDFGIAEGTLANSVNFSVIAGLYDGTAAGANAAWSNADPSFILDAGNTLYYDANGAGAGYSAVVTVDNPVAATDIQMVA